MNWPSANRIESAVDVAAAAMFAAAVAFALRAAVGDSGPILAAAAAAACLAAWAGLRRVPVEEPAYILPLFSPSPIEASALRSSAEADELLLEDALARVEPDARVVQLFLPGQPRGAAPRRYSAPPDASGALSDALAQLRRSLQ
jgi:hypothetical protein